MVDLVGIESTTSSMPFPRANEYSTRSNDTERYKETAILRLLCGFAAFQISLSDTE